MTKHVVSVLAAVRQRLWDSDSIVRESAASALPVLNEQLSPLHAKPTETFTFTFTPVWTGVDIKSASAHTPFLMRVNGRGFDVRWNNLSHGYVCELFKGETGTIVESDAINWRNISIDGPLSRAHVISSTRILCRFNSMGWQYPGGIYRVRLRLVKSSESELVALQAVKAVVSESIS